MHNYSNYPFHREIVEPEKFFTRKIWIGGDSERLENVLNLLFSIGYRWKGNYAHFHPIIPITFLYTDEDGTIFYSTSTRSIFHTCSFKEMVLKGKFSYFLEDRETFEFQGKNYYADDLAKLLSEADILPIS